MIDSREAAQEAYNYLKSLYQDVQAMQIEEVELSDDRDYWYITLSFIDRQSLTLPTYPPLKTYKQFKINAATGEVVSMKIRKV